MEEAAQNMPRGIRSTQEGDLCPPRRGHPGRALAINGYVRAYVVECGSPAIEPFPLLVPLSPCVCHWCLCGCQRPCHACAAIAIAAASAYAILIVCAAIAIAAASAYAILNACAAIAAAAANPHAIPIACADEIDAIGTKRYEANSGGEREIQRTMLELLNQLDGFDAMSEVKVSMHMRHGVTMCLCTPYRSASIHILTSDTGHVLM